MRGLAVKPSQACALAITLVLTKFCVQILLRTLEALKMLGGTQGEGNANIKLNQ